MDRISPLHNCLNVLVPKGIFRTVLFPDQLQVGFNLLLGATSHFADHGRWEASLVKEPDSAEVSKVAFDRFVRVVCSSHDLRFSVHLQVVFNDLALMGDAAADVALRPS